MVLPERQGEIFRGVVGEQGDDDGCIRIGVVQARGGFIGSKWSVPGFPGCTFRDLQRADRRRSSRWAEQQTFFLCEPVRHALRGFRGNAEAFVGHTRVPDPGDHGGLQVLEPFQGMHRTVGFHGDHVHVLALLLEEPPGAHNGPGGTEPGDEMRHTAMGLAPDLRTCRLEMAAPVRLVAVLVDIGVPALMLFRELARFDDRPVASFHGVGEHDFHAERAQDLLPFPRDVPREAEGDMQLVGWGDRCIGDPRVAARGVEQTSFASRFQCPGVQCVLDDVACGPVLDAAAGVCPFCFRIDRDAALMREALDVQKRRVPDELGDTDRAFAAVIRIPQGCRVRGGSGLAGHRVRVH